MHSGYSDKTIYDKCVYEKDLAESTKPLQYHMYFGKFENCNKCRCDKFYTKHSLVDIESELRNQTRPLSKCDQHKYQPTCKRSNSCISTFDRSVPVVLPPDLCPILFNNIPKQTSPGYTLPSANICR